MEKRSILKSTFGPIMEQAETEEIKSDEIKTEKIELPKIDFSLI